jgi:hypothetical protein
MAELNVDRLSLKLTGLSEEQGRRLVRLIAEGLADSPLGGTTGNQAAVQSKQTVSSGMSVEALSDQIVRDLLRQLS